MRVDFLLIRVDVGDLVGDPLSVGAQRVRIDAVFCARHLLGIAAVHRHCKNLTVVVAVAGHEHQGPSVGGPLRRAEALAIVRERPHRMGTNVDQDQLREVAVFFEIRTRFDKRDARTVGRYLGLARSNDERRASGNPNACAAAPAKVHAANAASTSLAKRIALPLSKGLLGKRDAFAATSDESVAL